MYPACVRGTLTAGPEGMRGSGADHCEFRTGLWPTAMNETLGRLVWSAGEAVGTRSAFHGAGEADGALDPRSLEDPHRGHGHDAPEHAGSTWFGRRPSHRRRRCGGDAMEVMLQRLAGLDGPKATVVACVRLVVGRKGTRDCRTFATPIASRRALLAWLAACRGTHVAMAATGVYGLPVFATPVSCAGVDHVGGNSYPAHKVPARPAYFSWGARHGPIPRAIRTAKLGTSHGGGITPVGSRPS
jgi:hypothetical protein